jgi:hypothetical protein
MKLNKGTNVETLTGAFGISDVRTEELRQILQSATKDYQKEGSELRVSDIISEVADKCTTPEELAFCSFELGSHLNEPSFEGLLQAFAGAEGISMPGAE